MTKALPAHDGKQTLIRGGREMSLGLLGSQGQEGTWGAAFKISATACWTNRRGQNPVGEASFFFSP